MSDEDLPKRIPDKRHSPGAKLSWLIVALFPAALILLVVGSSVSPGGKDSGFSFIVFFLNPIVSCIGCCGLAYSPERGKAVWIPLGIVLGLSFAVLNFVIGAFAGCLCELNSHGGFH